MKAWCPYANYKATSADVQSTCKMKAWCFNLVQILGFMKLTGARDQLNGCACVRSFTTWTYIIQAITVIN